MQHVSNEIESINDSSFFFYVTEFTAIDENTCILVKRQLEQKDAETYLLTGPYQNCYM